MRFCSVVPVDAFGGEYVPADQPVKWAQHGRAGADMIGQGRDVEVDALAGVGSAGSAADARQTWRRGSLPTGLARLGRVGGVTWNGAGGLGDLSHDRQVNFSCTVWITSLPRHDLQRFGDGRAEFGELAAAARAGGWAKELPPDRAAGVPETARAPAFCG